MKYSIVGFVGAKRASIDISSDLYIGASRAKSALLELLNLEEKLDMVVENYREFEMELLNITMSHMLFFTFDWSCLIQEINTMNRRIVNLLTACRLYMDHMIHTLNNIYGNNNRTSELVRTAMKKEYDDNLSYRIMESLRNFVQHRGLPIHEATHNNWLENYQRGDRHFNTTSIVLDVGELELEGGFKESVLEEMRKLDPKVDLKLTIRNYIESIQRIHARYRELVRDDFPKWEGTVQDVIDMFRKNSGAQENDVLGITMLAKDANGAGDKPIDIFSDFIKRRHALEQKNRLLRPLSKQVVTSEVRQERKKG